MSEIKLTDATNTMIDNICTAACLEMGMKKVRKRDLTDEELTKSGYSQPFSCTHIVDITDQPVTLDSFKERNPNIRATRGQFSIKYMNKHDKFRSGDKAFAIVQDLIKMPVHVSGPTHWRCLCERIPELGWIRRNSTLTDELFGIAKKHPGINFCFTLKFVEYADMITKKAEEQGLDIDHKPFLSYLCSKAEYERKFADKMFAPKRTKYDYQNEIREAYDLSVQERKTLLESEG